MKTMSKNLWLFVALLVLAAIKLVVISSAHVDHAKCVSFGVCGAMSERNCIVPITMRTAKPTATRGFGCTGKTIVSSGRSEDSRSSARQTTSALRS